LQLNPLRTSATAVLHIKSICRQSDAEDADFEENVAGNTALHWIWLFSMRNNIIQKAALRNKMDGKYL
jgi:hypothetical protein